MQILTKAEYDEAVERLSEQVYGPLGDSEAHEFAMEIIDLVDDGEAAEANERVKQRTFDIVWFDHPFEAEHGSIDSISAVIAGCIIEHSDGPRTLDRHYSDEHLSISKRNAVKSTKELAAAVLYTDVLTDARDRIRQTLDRHREQDREAA